MGIEVVQLDINYFIVTKGSSGYFTEVNPSLYEGYEKEGTYFTDLQKAVDFAEKLHANKISIKYPRTILKLE